MIENTATFSRSLSVPVAPAVASRLLRQEWIVLEFHMKGAGVLDRQHGTFNAIAFEEQSTLYS